MRAFSYRTFCPCDGHQGRPLIFSRSLEVHDRAWLQLAVSEPGIAPHSRRLPARSQTTLPPLARSPRSLSRAPQGGLFLRVPAHTSSDHLLHLARGGATPHGTTAPLPAPEWPRYTTRIYAHKCLTKSF